MKNDFQSSMVRTAALQTLPVDKLRALWDTSTSALVLHKKWGVFRALACTAAVFAVLISISALNAAGK